MYTCLIGQHVDVQRIDGHVYSGIFHAASFEKEIGKHYSSTFYLVIVVFSILVSLLYRFIFSVSFSLYVHTITIPFYVFFLLFLV